MIRRISESGARLGARRRHRRRPRPSARPAKDGIGERTLGSSETTYYASVACRTLKTRNERPLRLCVCIATPGSGMLQYLLQSLSRSAPRPARGNTSVKVSRSIALATLATRSLAGNTRQGRTHARHCRRRRRDDRRRKKTLESRVAA